MSCEETRDHLESCDECRLHVVVEAGLRSEPVLDPPAALLGRVMKALPRSLPVRREFTRLAAAAAILLAIFATGFAFGLDQNENVTGSIARVRETLAYAADTLNPLTHDLLRSELWRR